MEQQRQDDETFEVPRLSVKSINGFEGTVVRGLQVHKDGQHIVYPLGCTVVVEEIGSQAGEPKLLWGHTNSVTCITISHNGQLMASGQKTYPGFKADVIVWKFYDFEQLYKLTLHKVEIQALAFSMLDTVLASLGGCDDGSVVIWDMSNGNAICGSQAQVNSAGNTHCVEFSNSDDNTFVTGGDSTLRVWKLDRESRKIRPTDVNMGQMKREILCLQMNPFNDDYFFCGTTTGDVLMVNMATKRFQFSAPKKDLFQKGITALAVPKNNVLLVGTGTGQISELQFPIPTDKKEAKSKKLRSWKDESGKSESAITSIAMRGKGHQFFVGSAGGKMYRFYFETYKECEDSFKVNLLKTCHSAPVNDIIFPRGTSDLMLTCQHEQIRIWETKNNMELKRYVVANKTCNALACSCDGKHIISAWTDGTIRILGFKSQPASKGSQKKTEEFYLMSAIEKAHQRGVTAIATTHKYQTPDCYSIISGGGEGQVRVWQVRINRDNNELRTEFVAMLKEHKGSVSDIKIKSDDSECLSASHDGSCIIWDLRLNKRKQIVFANTLFKCVSYNNEENQLITSGTDRKIMYWEVLDGSPIRDLDGALKGAVNALDVATSPSDSNTTDYFVSGGDNQILKLWTYNGGEVTHVGIGHSAPITRVKISEDRKFITSVSSDGAIINWQFPNMNGH